MKTFQQFIMEASIIKHHYDNIYRVNHPDSTTHFGQLTKKGKKWHAEIRKSSTGDLVRHAGIWNKKSDAIEEIEHHLTRSPYKGHEE